MATGDAELPTENAPKSADVPPAEPHQTVTSRVPPVFRSTPSGNRGRWEGQSSSCEAGTAQTPNQTER